MRSRFAAYALGLGDYLFDTLASGHPDRATPRDAAVRELARMREGKRFMGLSVLHATENEVLFHARIFEKGKDISFAELSEFAQEDGAFRYASGVLVPASMLPDNVSTLTPERLLALAASVAGESEQ
jgi:SEC-C motif-containing protein